MQALIEAYRLIPQFYPVLEDLKAECVGEIARIETELNAIKRRRDYRDQHKNKYIHATKKLHACISAVERLKEDLKIMDVFVNGGI